MLELSPTDKATMEAVPTSERTASRPATAQILRHAIKFLDQGQPRIVQHPTWTLYWALTAAGAVSGSPRAEAVHAVVVAVMQARHPDWPTQGSLIRLVEAEGPAALREVLEQARASLSGSVGGTSQTLSTPTRRIAP